MHSFPRLARPIVLTPFLGFFLPLPTQAAPAAEAAEPRPLEIRMPSPARSWEREALPVGNGRLGAMIYGNPETDRIQFNEISLWSGGANESGDYKVEDFGTYQSFGDLKIQSLKSDGAPAKVPPAAKDAVTTSAQKAFVEDEGAHAATDGDASSKWCVEHGGKPVAWEWKLPAPARPATYGFVTANDAPARDPRTWRLEGLSSNGQWVALDDVENHPATSERGHRMLFQIDQPREVTALRLTFAPSADVPHFQVAEIEFPGLNVVDKGSPTGYERVLDLATGVQRTSWTSYGVRHTREVFASRPHEVIVVRWTCDQPGQIHARFQLGDPRASMAGSVHPQGIAIPEASLSNGLRYAAHAIIRSEGGTSAPDGDAFAVRAANSVTVVLAAATDYAMDPARGFRSGKSPRATATGQAETAAALDYPALLSAHLAGHTALMDRVSLDLGQSPSDLRALPTPERIRRHKNGGADRELETLVFQYGRYLLASSSRPGGLPANLQGLWADGLKPAWYADYHTNINIQMNYWQAEPANLADCHQALFDWVIACIPESRKATLKAFGEKTPGWTMRTSVNAFGGNGWQWNLPSSAWLAQHFWEHYAFGGDKEFLRSKAWPVFHDVSEFWLDHLKEDKNGKLIVPKGWSPEHGPREDGVAHDQQIVWDLFTNTLAAASALGINDAFTQRIAAAREKLLGPQIGSWGQLMEWTTERPELEKSGHRHTSHLFAVYPGNQISMARTPEWAKAAAVSLESRGTSGDSRRSWTWPWRTALWARLGQPEKAYDMVAGLFEHNTLPNLWTTHPPFQMDGNFGITAGICEVLLQSHAGEIVPLPALPSAWKSGSFRGLRARGGFTIDAAWDNGSLTSLVVFSNQGVPCRIRVPNGFQATDARGQPVNAVNRDGVTVFPTTRGGKYVLALPVGK